MVTTSSEKLRPVMTTSLESTEELEELDEDPQLTTDVVSNPEDTDLQLRLLEVRDRLQEQLKLRFGFYCWPKH